MKIFISWSGSYSHGVALAIKDWLPFIFPDIDAFVSSEDVRKGKRWLVEISKELANSNFGIICLTRKNLEAPWILFEAGALSKLKTANVCTLLMDNLRPGDIDGPLSHFQATQFTKVDVLKLTLSINSQRGKSGIDEPRLKAMVEKWWSDLESNVAKLPSDRKIGGDAHRSDREILYEVLEITRSIARDTSETQIQDLRKLRMLLKLPVSEIELSNGAVQFLLRSNIRDVGMLSIFKEKELSLFIGANKQIISEVKDKLKQFGLDFGMTYDPLVYP
jgi:TIR domain